MQVINNHHKLSWRCICNINSLKSVFSENNISLPYIAEAHICYCGKQSIAIDYEPQEPYYECPDCGNVMFLDANYYAGNSAFYEPILEIFSVDELKNLDFKIKYNKANKTIHAALIVPIPNGIDLATNTILYNEKKLFEFDITKNKFTEKQFVNFKTIDDSDDEYLFLDEPIEEHEIISFYKKSFINKIIEIDLFPRVSYLLKKCSNIDEVMFFIQNQHLHSFKFYKWENVAILPRKQQFSLYGAFKYLLQGRNEKSVKRTLMENYQFQMNEYGKFDILFPYVICKHIKDPNIANKMLKINKNEYCRPPFLRHKRVDIFFEFLTERYSDSQILHLFKDFMGNKCNQVGVIPIECAYFTHTTMLIEDLGVQMRQLIPPVRCNIQQLHDEIARSHRLMIEDKLFKYKFKYTEAQHKACIKDSSRLYYDDILLPKNGQELYEWSIALDNCLSGYAQIIASGAAVVYGFFLNNKIKIAVEVTDNTIMQARFKGNAQIDPLTEQYVNLWFETYVKPHLIIKNNRLLRDRFSEYDGPF